VAWELAPGLWYDSIAAADDHSIEGEKGHRAEEGHHEAGSLAFTVESERTSD
jgi:hypothetical protein